MPDRVVGSLDTPRGRSAVTCHTLTPCYSTSAFAQGYSAAASQNAQSEADMSPSFDPSSVHLSAACVLKKTGIANRVPDMIRSMQCTFSQPEENIAAQPPTGGRRVSDR
eukprot:CAMPEP_0181172160 /NCGR_PEP_ID=MMETSP1096-20121128/2303_1 /TAXON_ID=156174 ORGANISM="Chrysochromulina ericina, Strain CCMP281" /NCGR_SAMPLE_ID=MMETSP1096 /ASSEMBLY_ACC=CAM_ASM_000453 /LENGTH=108 /DNA_ID=CAMNT_0023259873 /DNA_START=338 /DNA_END=660 /DNA_ORIENTATION=+